MTDKPKHKTNKPKFTADDMIAALTKTKGMVYLAADVLGCAPNTVYNYAKNYPTVQQAIDNQRGQFLDKTELALDKAVDRGDGWAIAFALKTLGKHRGYVEKQLVEQKTTNIEVDLNSLTDEQLKRLGAGEDIASIVASEK